MPFILANAYATHVSNVEDFEWHIWSRNSTDGHTGLLNCDSNNDYCAVKVKVTSGVQTLSKSAIITKVNSAETMIDNLGKKMSIDRVTTGTDNEIKSGRLGTYENGKAQYDLHCTNKGWFGCNSEDMHFVKMTLLLNDNQAKAKIRDYDSATSTPQVYDIDKILRHELFHVMGIDHNNSTNSIVHYTYVFGATGLHPISQDVRDLEARYP